MQGPASNGSSAGFVVTVLRYASYLFWWLVLAALGGLLAWSLRTNVFDLGVWLRWNPWVVRGIDRWAIFVFGILWISYIFAIEGYLRMAVPKHRLWSRTRRILIPMLFLCALSYSVQFRTLLLNLL